MLKKIGANETSSMSSPGRHGLLHEFFHHEHFTPQILFSNETRISITYFQNCISVYETFITLHITYTCQIDDLHVRGYNLMKWYGAAQSSREQCDGDDGSGWLSGITWCHRWTLLAWTLMPMQQLSNPVGYSWLHTLAHVAVDHETVVCNLLIPNGTTDHTKLAVVYHQI
jgi:hypothetical protein